MRLRARADSRPPANPTSVAASERLKARQEDEGRDLGTLQAALKRLDVAARQLELVAGYLASPDSHVSEPSITDPDEVHAAGPMRIIQAREAERQRLAEEIHDGPAQVLTSAIFQV